MRGHRVVVGVYSVHVAGDVPVGESAGMREREREGGRRREKFAEREVKCMRSMSRTRTLSLSNTHTHTHMHTQAHKLSPVPESVIRTQLGKQIESPKSISERFVCACGR